MLCFSSAKGGVGCSVVAASVSLLLSERSPVLLVDLDGDQADILGLASGSAGSAAGLDSWVASEQPAPDALRWLEQPVGDGLSLLRIGHERAKLTSDKLALLATLLRTEQRRVVIDIGSHNNLQPLLSHVARSVLVTNPCYIALSRARTRPASDGIVLVNEPHRALRSDDVESVLDASIVAVVPYEPQVFRAVDAGLLASRMPRSLRRLDVFG